MNIKFKKWTAIATCSATLVLLLAACQNFKKEKKVVNDCSGLFETRYVDGTKGVSSKGRSSAIAYTENDSNQMTECKILEVKLDKDLKCEIVGSDTINDLKTLLEDNRNDKIIFITPQDKVRDLTKLANKYLKTGGVDIEKYFSSDVVKNLKYPYKGMRCLVSDKEFVAWIGDEKVILTIGDK